MDIRISVIILNWNGKPLLPDCLSSLKAQTFQEFEVILVDNGSSDGSATYVREHHPWVRLLELAENTGFAEGNNRGLSMAQGEYIATLNNDTKVSPDFLAELVRPMAENPGIGMVAAKMLNFFRTDRIDSFGIHPTTAGIGCNTGIGETDSGRYDAPAEVFGPCAGAALYRRTMLEQTGFFDPDFFAYYEDLDLAWRARLADWKAVAAPAALVYHVHSATAGRMSAFTVYQTHRNKWFVIIKNWPLSLIIRHLPAIMAYDSAALLLAIIKGKMMPALRARLHLLAAIPGLFKKRKSVRELRKISTADMEQFLMPAASPLKILKRKMGGGI